MSLLGSKAVASPRKGSPRSWRDVAPRKAMEPSVRSDEPALLYRLANQKLESRKTARNSSGEGCGRASERRGEVELRPDQGERAGRDVGRGH